MFCATMVAMMLCFASCKEKAQEANCIIDGHECVDMGLSVKWATCNVGASIPEEVGDYFAWGEVLPKEKYSNENSITYGDPTIGNIAGNAQYDAATANWGGSWRIPTEEELRELKNKCRTNGLHATV